MSTEAAPGGYLDTSETQGKVEPPRNGVRKRLGHPLADIRRAAGYGSAAEAAKVLMVSRVHLLNIERGFSHGSPALIKRMAETYHASAPRIEKAIASARRRLLERMLESS